MSEANDAAAAEPAGPDDARRENTGAAQPLENVLIALQKTFSRVSASSSLLPPEDARSLILGDVNFEMAVPLEAGQDKLFYSPAGKVNLKLTGTIQQDVRPVPQDPTGP